MGDVSGDRPRILNLTIVGPKCGGGNPTTFIGKEGNGKIELYSRFVMAYTSKPP